MLEVRLLGQFDLKLDGAPIPLASRASQSLLAYLLLHRGTAHRREKLAGLLWPNATDANARNNLRQTLHRLRRAVETGGQVYFLADDLTVAFDAQAAYWLDVAVLEQKPSQGNADELLSLVRVYGGELLPGFYDDWVVLERERLQTVFERRMKELLDRLVEARRWPEVLEWGERWIALGNTPEPAYCALMRAHASLGDSSSVAVIFQRCVEALRRELGVEPSEQTRALFERLSKGEAMAEAVRGHLPAGVRLEDLGERVVKGFREAQRLFQVTAPEMPVDVAPSAVPSVPRHNLPSQLSSFVGRERDVAQVKALLARSRLVTLTGAGGSGKTRLALHVAAEVLDTFAHGAWLVELAPLSDPALVPQAVASALDVREEQGRPLMTALLDYLREKDLLLLLDNCEHLIEACAQLTDTLLRASPNLRILATSREVLNIVGETTWLVPTLSLPEPQPPSSLESLMQSDAVRLFVERAAAARPDFALTRQNSAAIVQVCQRLDGLPLAIELATPLVKALTVEQLAERLEARFQLLTGGRTAPARHQTLRAMMDWSYKLLLASEQTLLQRLSVFAGGWTLEAAEAVCSGDGMEAQDVLPLLRQLVDKSLLTVQDHEG